VRVAVFSPRAEKGDALGLLLARLPAEMQVVLVREGEEPPPADLALLDVADGAAHAFAFRAARERPGVVLLRDSTLPSTLAREMADRARRASVLREMQRAYGDDGVFVARQVARGLGGDLLPRLFPPTDRLLETCLGLVTLTEGVRARAARRLGARPSLVLPLHLLAASRPLSPLTRDTARRALHLPASSAVIAMDGCATSRVELGARMLERLRERLSGLRLVVVGGASALPEGVTRAQDFATATVAADVVLALDDPFAGAVPAGFEDALGSERALVVSAGSAAAADFSEGTLALVEPGRLEPAHLEALLLHLLGSTGRSAALARLARAEALRLADPSAMAASLAAFLGRVLADAPAILAAIRAAQAREDTLLGQLLDEVRFGERTLGLADLDLGLRPLLEGLLRPTR
jgi:hypothetical protein